MSGINNYQDLATFEHGSVGATYGTNEGEIGGASVTEHGVDISLPANNQVLLPFAGIFRPDLSTKLQAVFQLDNNWFESVTHIDVAQGLSGLIPQGGVIGNVDASGSGTNVPFYGTNTGSGVNYYSTGPHIEVGFARGVTNPVDFYGSKAVSPLQAFGQILSPTSALPGITSTPPDSGTVSGAPPSSVTVTKGDIEGSKNAGNTHNSDQICLPVFPGINIGPFSTPSQSLCFPNPIHALERFGVILLLVVLILIVFALLGGSLIKGETGGKIPA